LLRPAESAARRLDVLVALRLPMPELPRYRPSKPKPALPPKPRGKPINLGIALPVAAPHNADGGGAAPATPSPLRGSEGRVRPVAHPIQGGVATFVRLLERAAPMLALRLGTLVRLS